MTTQHRRADRSGVYPRPADPGLELVLLVACSAIASIIALIIAVAARCA
jgi:hypothetical protein